MDKKVTIWDIADRLGVSTTTINTALGGKGRISEEKRRLVVETAAQMGYKANKAAKSLARKPIKIGFLIEKSVMHDFFDYKVISGAKRALEGVADFNVAGDFEITNSGKERNIISRMREMANAGYNGIIVSPNDMHDFTEAIDDLSRRIPIVTIISDVSNQESLFSVRTNGRLSGKMAEEILWILAKDKPVAVFTGYKESGIHKETIDGFREQMLTRPLNLAGIYENHDDPEIARASFDRLLLEHPEVEGLYISTANSVSVCKRIAELGLQSRIKVVASDLFPEMVQYINQGIVCATIYQEPFNIGRLAFQYLYEHLAEGKDFGRDILLNPRIVMSSNLELFLHGDEEDTK